jgi:hypothetical protein
LTTLANAKAKTNETFIVHVSLTIVTYDHKNKFIVQATGLSDPGKLFQPSLTNTIAHYKNPVITDKKVL